MVQGQEKTTENPSMKEFTAAERVWIKASYDMLFNKRRAPGWQLLDLMEPRWTGLDNNPPPIPEGEWPWDITPE